MGYYNVIAPCVVAGLHHVRPTVQPIEVDDEKAAPLVEAGCLAPYQPGRTPGDTGTVLDGVLIEPTTGLLPQWHSSEPLTDPLDNEVGQAVIEAASNSDASAEAQPKPRRPRKRTED